jgi:signal transduction histidine kinase
MGALAVVAFGAATSLLASATPGVGGDDVSAVVVSVVPGSPGWRDGIRPGDRIVAFSTSYDPGGWSMLVSHGPVQLGTSAVANEAALRTTAEAVVVGMVLLLIGLALVARGWTPGLSLVSPGVALGAVPLVHTGGVGDLAAAGIATFLVAGASVAAVRMRRRERLVALAVTVTLSAVWIASIFGAPALFDGLDAARVPIAGVFGVWGLASADWRPAVAWLRAPDGPRVIDLVWPPVVAAALGAAVLFAGIQPLAAIGLLAAAVVAYPATRRLAVGGFEALVVGNVRRRAELQAAEDERGRVAREIHDAPLQELAAVIRRLEARPDTDGETAALRDVAAQLREVASALRSPVLDDLGIAAALEDLGEAFATAYPERRVEVHVDDLGSVGERPPADVEAAAFRIAQEAAGNALRHSTGSLVSLTATVSPRVLDVTVSDDGEGIDREAAAQARRAWHFGLQSMRERAAAVGGKVEITSSSEGVEVRFTWEGTG